MKRSMMFAVASVLTGATALVGACTGDDPAPSTADPDTGTSDAPAGEASGNDSGGDASDAGADVVDASRCDPTKPFAAPVLLANINSAPDAGFDERNATLSLDELTIYLTSTRNRIDGELFVATRANRDADFGAPSLLAGAGAASGSDHPSLTENGLAIYMATTTDLVVFSRPSTTAAFSNAVSLNITSTDNDRTPTITPDGTTLYFASMRGPSTSLDLWQANVLGDGGFSDPSPMTELAEAGIEVAPAISQDGLEIFFTSDRSGSLLVWTAKRTIPSSVFGSPTLVGELGAGVFDFPMWVSPDHCALYLSSARADGTHSHLYRAVRGK